MLVRYYGHVGVPSGYGDAANELCMAMLSAGMDLEIQTDGTQLHKRFLPLATCVRAIDDLSPNPDVVIIHTLPLDCLKVLKHVRESLEGGSRARGRDPLYVAYTTWEGVGYAGPIFGVAEEFDRLWVPSNSNAAAFSECSSASLIRGIPDVVPHAYDPDELEGKVVPCRRDMRYAFLYSGAWSMRKNVEGVIRAYLRAFTASDAVVLKLNCSDAAPDACRIAQVATGLTLEQMPTVEFSNTRVSDDEIWAMHASTDCFVTASRGEAWNLPAFKAMLAGQHVIAPSGQGSDDFLRGTSAYLYESRVVPASGEVRLDNITAEGATARYWGCQGLTVREDWMEPDIASLSLLMRRAWAQHVIRLDIHYDPAARFGREVVGKYVRDLLEGALR
jgi:glycosyltransferase involved in cell wall biosynthesis